MVKKIKNKDNDYWTFLINKKITKIDKEEFGIYYKDTELVWEESSDDCCAIIKVDMESLWEGIHLTFDTKTSEEFNKKISENPIILLKIKLQEYGFDLFLKEGEKIHRLPVNAYESNNGYYSPQLYLNFNEAICPSNIKWIEYYSYDWYIREK